MRRVVSIGIAVLSLWGCGGALGGCGGAGGPAVDDAADGDTGSPADDGAGSTSGAVGTAGDDGDDGGSSGDDGGESDSGGEEDDAIRVTHAFGKVQLSPFEDNVSTCASWTIENELPLYANAVVLANEGAFHHSNWYVVPETEYVGPDGYFPCDDRGFQDIQAAQKGTVLFAQSTQSYVEEQRLAPGAVVKIPERSRVVASVHALNLAPRDAESGLWLTLELIHPAEVTAVVTPLSLQYHDLTIPAMTEARYVADCNLAVPYAIAGGGPLALRLHYILPHYHYLGNYFDVTIVGGLRDGESVYSLAGFTGEANGLTFDPPIDLPGATGLRMTCGYDNWRSENVGWGNGDGEMCVMLALVESDYVMGASVELGSHVVDVQDDILIHEGSCLGLAVPKTAGQTPPTEQEKLAPLYLPPIDPDDADLPPVPECVDTPAGADAESPVTLTSVRETVIAPACTFSACHGVSAAGGLDLSAGDLRDTLLSHDLLVDPGMPLVTPGDPEQSWLYHLLSRCEPTLPSGNVVSHMPRNAPILLDPVLVAKVRDWIAAGAGDD